MARLFWMCVVIALLFSSCGTNGQQPLAMVESVVAKYPEIPFGQIVYHDGARSGQRDFMTDRLRSFLYDEGRMRDIPEWSQVISYAVVPADRLGGAELHVFYMKSRADARAMQMILQRRAELLKKRSIYLFAPGAYENYYASARVEVKGSFVFLLATGNNDAVWKHLGAMI